MTTACSKEKKQQSNHSPGVVSDEEHILYVLLEPDQWKYGQLTKAAFSDSKLCACDLSVARQEHTDLDAILENVVVPQIDKNPTRQFVGLLMAPCALIRGLRVGESDGTRGDRATCVIDDGISGYEAHSLMAYSESVRRQNRNVRLSVRANLIDTFGALMDPGNVFGSA